MEDTRKPTFKKCLVEVLRMIAFRTPEDLEVVFPTGSESVGIKEGTHSLTNLLQYLADMLEE